MDCIRVAAVRDEKRARARLGDTLQYAEYDITRPETFDTAFRNVHSVFLMLPPSRIAAKERGALIAAMETAGVAQVVLLSVLGAEKLRIVPHRTFERALETSRLSWTFLRAGFFMQNFNSTLREDLIDRRQIYVPAGHGKQNLVDVRDVAEVAAQALTEAGYARKAYPLTTSEALDYYEIARDFTDILQTRIVYRNPSLLTFIPTMLRRHKSLSYTLLMATEFSVTALGFANSVWPDMAQVLGRPPRTLRQYITDYRDVWLSS